jgi:hypothetical protein
MALPGPVQHRYPTTNGSLSDDEWLAALYRENQVIRSHAVSFETAGFGCDVSGLFFRGKKDRLRCDRHQQPGPEAMSSPSLASVYAAGPCTSLGHWPVAITHTSWPNAAAIIGETTWSANI